MVRYPCHVSVARHHKHPYGNSGDFEMKTLDEVIKVMDHVEFCCTNCKLQFDCNEVECFLEDALHYLKEYQKHLKWQAYEENCLAEEKKKIKQAYEQGYAKAKHDDAIARSWEESYRQSQMPWNRYTEMGG